MADNLIGLANSIHSRNRATAAERDADIIEPLKNEIRELRADREALLAKLEAVTAERDNWRKQALEENASVDVMAKSAAAKAKKVAKKAK